MNEEQVPVRTEDARNREISIRPLNYGYLVSVGCHSFAIEDKNKLINKLTAYINNPNEVEEQWYKTKTI